MLHPLDEVTPVFCHTGGNTIASKLSFMTQTSQQIVFTCDQPSIVMIYDKALSCHSVWAMRMATSEVKFSLLYIADETQEIFV
jgi:anaphase-promoting complex subunit 1